LLFGNEQEKVVMLSATLDRSTWACTPETHLAHGLSNDQLQGDNPYLQCGSTPWHEPAGCLLPGAVAPGDTRGEKGNS